MAINYQSKEDVGYLFIALRECCGLDSNTVFKVKDLQSAGSYAGIEILESDTNEVTIPSESDLEAKFETVKKRENFAKLRRQRNKLLKESDWTQSNSASLDFIKNKPTLATVAISGSYSDLTGTPTLVSSLNNLSDVNTSGAVVNKILKYDGSNWVVADDANSAADGNTTYTQSSVADSSNVKLRLTGSDSTNDDILITAGNNINISNVTTTSNIIIVTVTITTTNEGWPLSAFTATIINN